MPIPLNIAQMVGSPVGVSLQNGQGTSGVLCGVQNRELYLMEYLYQEQFALKHYPADDIRDVTAYPPCRLPGAEPMPRPAPWPVPHHGPHDGQWHDHGEAWHGHRHWVY